jgi:hypothetical protein
MPPKPAVAPAAHSLLPSALDIDEPFADTVPLERARGVPALDDPFGEMDAAPPRQAAPLPRPAAALPRPAISLRSEAPKSKPLSPVVDDDHLDDIKSFFTRKSMPPPPPARGSAPPQPRPAQPQPRPAAKPGLSDEKLQSIYRAYLTARKRCNEPTETVTFDKLAQSLRKQAAAKGESVDFKVVIREGKAMIKLVKS